MQNNESYIANSLRYKGVGLKAVPHANYRPSEEDMKRAEEEEQKYQRREMALAIIATAERLVLSFDLDVAEAFNKAEQFKEHAEKFLEAKV